jgi:hypothetical protein
MRVIKLSYRDPEFDSWDDLVNYFENKLPNMIERDRAGKFRCKNNVRWGKPRPGEPLLFTLDSRLVYLALCKLGAQENFDQFKDDYARFFIVDCDTIRRPQSELPLDELEQQLNELTVETYTLRSQGWNEIPDTTTLTSWFNKL